MKNSETKDFVAYEYLSIDVASEKEALYIDCYENFGWRLTNSTIHSGLIDQEDYYINSSNVNNVRLVNLKFKRDRKIPNKAKVITLQKKCDNGLKELSRLEKQPNFKASIYAVAISIIGAIFLSISIFFIINESIFGIVLGGIGLISWFLSYPIYKKVRIKQEELNTSLIEEQYHIIYDSCEQAQKLLN